MLLNTIQEGQSAGVFRNNDPLNLARGAWSLVHGQSMLILDRKLQVQPEEELNGFLQFSAQILMNGIYNQ